MKTPNFFITLMLFIGLISCDKDNQQNYNIENPTMLSRKAKCPPGSFEVWTYEFSSFRFKRPIMDCESGFWFCTKDGQWVLDCKDTAGNSYPPIAKINSNIVTVHALPDRERNVITFIFPYELVTKPGNNVNEFRIFNVDESLVIDDMKLVIGNYPSIFTNDQILIDVPFTN